MKIAIITFTFILITQNIYADIKSLNIKNKDISQLSQIEKKALLIKLKKYKKMFLSLKEEKDELKKIRHVNLFFNKTFVFQDDKILYRKKDYWATRKEFFLKGLGDCEDYVIAKYFTLINLGIEKDKLHILYSKYKKTDHLVLAYKNNDSLVFLDNNVNDIFKIDENKYLKPLFSVKKINRKNKLSMKKVIVSLKWRDVLNRIKT